MLKRSLFFFCAALAGTACAATTPAPTEPAAAEPPPVTERIPLDNGRSLTVIVPDGWTFELVNNDSDADDGLPEKGGVLQRKDINAFVLITTLDHSGKTATQEAQDIAAKVIASGGGVTPGRIIPFPDNPQATFKVSTCEMTGAVTVRHLGEKEDVPVVFFGGWPPAQGKLARSPYWATVFRTEAQ